VRGLSGKSAIITGAARGIGFEITRRLLAEGCRVFVCDRDTDALDQALAQLGPGSDTKVAGRECDIGAEDQIEEMVRAAVGHLHQIDVLVNNAGVAALSPALETSTAVWDEVLRVNLTGSFQVARAVAKRMVAAGTGGAIVNISSTNGLVAEVGYAAYNASKAGLLLLSQTMAVELASSGVRVNCVCPGYIVTPLSKELDDAAFVDRYVHDHIPIGRTGTPEDVASVVAFLASAESAFVTGTAIVVDGGQIAHSGNR
jgi:NAD(P)-dependent dehydrogenase (short-subunit alcohol dehydrogenase family)